MDKRIIVFLFLLYSSVMNAQSSLNGIYRLHNIQDMAAAFQFLPDNTFEFFYSYGAVDRKAKGTYTFDGDTIKLNSDKIGGADFEITEQRISGKTYKVVVRDENQYLTQKVKAIVTFGNLTKEFEANEDGVINIDTKNCEKIFLVHELYPDVASKIKDELNANTYFEVRLKPSLEDVSFKGINLIKNGENFKCLPNYFLPFSNILFVKED
ncbi:MAG TPA: hypothetical protein PKC85_00260 [Bacteroidia bacterium]|jgi:hypothetical protein|nr:hypothetical protein [Bacteroidia bacterium]HMU18251.1 hypothetical protein [Bacteroidia bacterium]